MFCGKCGAENENGAKFCKNCGELLANGEGQAEDGSISNAANSLPKVDMGNVSEKVKTLPMKAIGIACAVVVALIAIILIVTNAAKTINLNEYLTIEAEGYDGRGKAKAIIDWDAMKAKYGTKISFTSEAKRRYGEDLKFLNPVDVLDSGIYVKLSEDSKLSNGDSIEYTWSVEDDLANIIKCKLKYKDESYTVSGLQEVGFFDPFDGVEIGFSGTAPNGRSELINTPDDNGLYYTLENGNHVSNGDTVTVKASYGWYDEDSYIEEHGKLPSTMSKDYVVEGLDEFVTTYSDIDECLLADMKVQSEDTISAYVAKSYDQTSSLSGLEYMGYVFCGAKADVDYWSTYNALYLIYRGNVANTEGKFDAVDVYFPVEFTNFLKNSDGVHYESCNGIEGSSSFGNSWYSTKGYTNPLTAYIDLAESKKAEYSIECGDGFEAYSEYTLVSKLEDIDGGYLAELETKATDTVLSYIAKSYSDESHVNGLEVKGEYLLVAKNQGTDFGKNNMLVIVLGGNVSNDRKRFEACDVYYPVEFDGIVNLPDKWMYTNNSGILGYSDFEKSWYSTKGYIDGTKMFSDVITSKRDNYTYEVSEGLKEFGE